MRIPENLRRWLLARALRTMAARRCDDPIGPDGNPYLERWHLREKRPGRWNLFLHRIRRSDDERALHDHPWWSLSIILDGGYLEVVPVKRRHLAGPTRVILRRPGDVVFRRARAAHRLVLRHTYTVQGKPADLVAGITLFVTGRATRAWGFWCPQGWRPSRAFTMAAEGSPRGRGCA